jgi:hypothetical protein
MSMRNETVTEFVVGYEPEFSTVPTHSKSHRRGKRFQII